MNEKLGSKIARRNFGLKYSRWFKSNNLDEDDANDLAFNRLKLDTVYPATDNFSFSRSSRLFAIGSCFARGIEKTLFDKGLDVRSISERFNSFELRNNQVTGLGFTNKYSTHSILNQISWSLGEHDFPYNSIVDISNDLYVDPNTNPSLKYVGKERTIERRDILNNVVSEIKECDVIIVTLGLIEVWYDNEAGIYLNMTPTIDMINKYPGRYEFEISDFKSNFDNVNSVYKLLKKYCKSDFKLIITVSPVPLMATYSGQDVIRANTYSKALLRTVAEEIISMYRNVHYFPSDEMVMNSDKSVVWENDLRHVKGSFVQKIMNHFIDNHVVN